MSRYLRPFEEMSGLDQRSLTKIGFEHGPPIRGQRLPLVPFLTPADHPRVVFNPFRE